MHLAVAENQRITAECIGFYRKHAHVVKLHIGAHIADATVPTDNFRDQISGIEREIATHRLRRIETGQIERRMGADLKTELFGAGVDDAPLNSNSCLIKRIAYLKTERPGKLFESLGCRFKHVEQFVFGSVSHRLELHVAGKTVLLHLILAAINAENAVPQRPDYREKHRRAPFPKRRIALPEIFIPTGFACYALKFGAERRHLDFEKIVFENTVHRHH